MLCLPAPRVVCASLECALAWWGVFACPGSMHMIRAKLIALIMAQDAAVCASARASGRRRHTCVPQHLSDARQLCSFPFGAGPRHPAGSCESVMYNAQCHARVQKGCACRHAAARPQASARARAQNSTVGIQLYIGRFQTRAAAERACDLVGIGLLGPRLPGSVLRQPRRPITPRRTCRS